jgi:gliding motility-associated-like protein
VRNNVNVYLKGLLFPNAFTPNASGSSDGRYDIENIKNDIFFPKFEDVKTYHLMIYNRWGELIHETFDLKQGWDGYYHGKICQQDVYVWKVEVAFEDDPDKVFIYKGDLTLLR